MRISGSLWSVPTGDQPEQLSEAVQAGISAIHWDFADGTFARAGGFDAQSARRLLNQAAPVESEVHLMVQRPLEVIADWADFCSLVIVPLELDDTKEALDAITAHGAQPGVAVSLETPLEQVPPNLPVLLMAITPGEAGQPFDSKVLKRVETLRAWGHNQLIGVDGGVGPAQFEALSDAGANWIVSGGSLFSAPEPAQWMDDCRRVFTR